jgi:predicted transposase/invertase (TIGR01784 family)
MRTTLDPKLDVVFKLLFADERNKPLLLSLLAAFLDPSSPIEDVTVLNPETPKETVLTKGAVLDLRARMKDGRLVDIEMQTTPHAAFISRGLFYWAKVYASQLSRGDDHAGLRPVISILLLNFSVLQTVRYHSVFHLLETHEHERLTDDLEIHLLELPKLPRSTAATGDPEVLRWGQFFAAETDQQLEQLAMSDANINQAKAALERLSLDPAAQELARDRELAAWNYKETMRLERLAGIEEGIEQGTEQGIEKTILHLCKICDVEVTPGRLAELREPRTDLQHVLEELVRNRRWPLPR